LKRQFHVHFERFRSDTTQRQLEFESLSPKTRPSLEDRRRHPFELRIAAPQTCNSNPCGALRPVLSPFELHFTASTALYRNLSGRSDQVERQVLELNGKIDLFRSESPPPGETTAAKDKLQVVCGDLPCRLDDFKRFRHPKRQVTISSLKPADLQK